MIELLFALVFALVAHPHAAPAPAVHGPAPAAGALAPGAGADASPRGVSAGPTVGARTVPADPPRPAPTVATQGQLPEEVIGRQIDGPDGQVCTVVSADLTLACP